MAIEFIFLRSKFARRMFLLFVTSALIPVATLAYLSYFYVDERLTEQSFQRSRHAAKSFGLDVLSRLRLADSELRRFGALMSPGDQRTFYAENLESAFLLIARTTQPDSIPGNRLQEIQLNPFSTLLLGLNHEVYLARKVADNEWIHGELNPDFLFAAQSRIQGEGEFCMANRFTQLLACSDPTTREVFQRQIDQFEFESTSGRFNWHMEGAQYLTSYWTVFLRGSFKSGDWTVYVSQTEEEALSALQGFHQLFLPVVMLSLLIIVFVTITSIRTRLSPLDQLRQATLKVSAGSIRQDLTISSGDEFQELAEHFNAMTGRLDRQFHRLSLMAEIDRLVLSSRDIRAIVDSILERTLELESCNVVGVLLVDVDRLSHAEVTFRTDDDDEPKRYAVDISKFNTPTLWRDQIGPVVVPSELPEFARPMCTTQVISCRMLPVFMKDSLYVAIMIGYSEILQESDENTAQLSELADRVAVAISNARWEDALYHRAHYDQLTELPNRALLHDRLLQSMVRADRDKNFVAVLLVDLDRFKDINDSFGHTAGDQMLKEMSSRLIACVRNVDTVVRFGGDEFVIILGEFETELEFLRAIDIVSNKILKAVQEPFDLEGRSLVMNASIGVSRYPGDGESLEDLIKFADASMYQAKAGGGGAYQVYDRKFTVASKERLELEYDLRHAATRGELALHYQPQIDRVLGCISGAEALLRWNHPRLGMVSPGKFIPIAEETRLILDLGDWVLLNACKKIKQLQLDGVANCRISVNVSGAQFRHSNVADIVEKYLGDLDLDPHLLGIELTETDVMGELDDVAETLGRLSEMGVHLAIDDFGTGYSSLNYLQRLPFDELKIDYSFTHEIGEDSNGENIIIAIIALARALDMSVIAEGVETERQLTFLCDQKCDGFQGWLFCPAMPEDQFEQTLRARQNFIHRTHKANLGT